MKHSTSILKYSLPLIVVVLAASIPSVLSQNCPFGDGGRVIYLEGDDNVDVTTVLFSGETELDVTDVTIGRNPNLPTPGSLLNVAWLQEDGKTTVNLFANQPKFGVQSDYYGFTYEQTGGEADALQIVVNGGGTLVCYLGLTIHDTNNLAPHFNTTSDKVDFEFTVTTAWDKKGVPLNWKGDDRIRVTDWDRTRSDPEFEIVAKDNEIDIRVESVYLGEIEYAQVWEVELYVEGDMSEDRYEFSVTPYDDGGNLGEPINVILNVEEVNLFEPVFTSEVYYELLESMPEVGKLLDATPTCKDPDDLMNGRESVFEYTLVSDEGVGDYLRVIDTNRLEFYNVVPETLMGKTVTATVSATKTGSSDPVSCKVKLTFPLPSKIEFPDKIETIVRDSWPVAGERILIPQAVGDLEIYYELGTSNDGLITLEKDGVYDVIQFKTDLTSDMLGELEENRVVIFDIVAKYKRVPSPDLGDVVMVVLSFPREETTNPTTVQECETCEVCSSTGYPSTEVTTECSCEVTEVTCATEFPVTPCDCEGSTPDYTPPECPPPTTCEPGSTGNPVTEFTTECDCEVTTEVTCVTELPSTPCDCGGSTPDTTPPDNTTPPPECPPPTTCEPGSTGNPTTEYSGVTEECPVCSTTEASDVTCGTSSVDPCDCSSSSENPTTCPTVPCDCEGVEPCEPEDCSTTGLVVAVITTSILCACSIVAGGYCLWLLRKATLDPTKLARDSIFERPTSSSPNDPTGEYATPHRFSFGDGHEYESGSRFGEPVASGGVEPGFSNPNFTNDAGVVETPASINPIVTPLPQTSSTEPIIRRKSSIKPPKDIEPDYDESPKKSNMKAPKEIEPDYEEVVPVPEPVVVDSGKQSRVLFAPEDEYISIDGGSGEVVGDGGVGDEGSDVEDERL